MKKLAGLFAAVIVTIIIGLIFLNVTKSNQSVLAAPGFNDPGFANTWRRADLPVEQVAGLQRGYTWGPTVPGSERVLTERYNGGTRKVQYFDKARMEVNNPAANPADLYYVTTGLLVKELVTGNQQEGDSSFTQLAPSSVQVVGDSNLSGANAVAPTYASFNGLDSFGEDGGTASTPGSKLTRRINRVGQVSSFTPPETRSVGGYDEVTRHNIADVFVTFSNQRGIIWNGRQNVEDSLFFNNPTYVLGRPLTEPYWTRASVAGAEKDVLVQLFERRAITYTPTNPEAYRVEMGNVGQHYYQWRYVQATPSGVSNERFAKLTKGVNLSHWFSAFLEKPTAEYYQNFMKREDLQRIRDLGFRHVRLPVDPGTLLNQNSPETLDPYILAHLDRALDTILAQKLAVIVDMHPEPDFKKRVATEPAFASAFERFWGSLARHLSQRDPEQVFLETMNEPTFETIFDGDETSARRWSAVQQRLVTAMRAGAPKHTIIVNTHEYGVAAELLQLTPLKDPNIVYNFHFYDPFPFTHQGATWAGETPRYWKNLPYPSSPSACQNVLPAIDQRGRPEAVQYCNESWDRSKLEKNIVTAVAWARQHNVRLTVNEFGVYRLVSPPANRIAWLRDVRTIFDKYKIGWAMWDYTGGFGVVQEDSEGVRTTDPETVRALGL